MRWIKFLRALLGFVYFFSILSAIAAPLLFFFSTMDSKIAFNLSGTEIENVHWSFYMVVAMAVLAQFLFVAMIYYMKKASWLLNPKKIFSTELSRYLNYAGILCLVSIVLYKVPINIYRVVFGRQFDSAKNLNISFDFGFSFDSMLVIIAFGIFLVITSKIIRASALIKQENDLTI